MTRRPRPRVEPWLISLSRAARRRREPLVFLLLSAEELVALTCGTVPPRAKRQARQALDCLAGLPPKSLPKGALHGE